MNFAGESLVVMVRRIGIMNERLVILKKRLGKSVSQNHGCDLEKNGSKRLRAGNFRASVAGQHLREFSELGAVMAAPPRFRAALSSYPFSD